MFICTYSLKSTQHQKKRGFDLKSNFHIIFKSYRDKILVRKIAKQQSIYRNNIERFE